MTTDWKFSNCKVKPLLLFSCLDWGLGHTTRSVPLIREFLNSGCDMIVACNSTQKAILENEFLGLKYVELSGYNVSYGRDHVHTRLKIILQLYKILIKIKYENNWLRGFLNENKVNAVISDNRYGLCHPNVACILITHQLKVRSGYGIMADRAVQKFLYRFINRFTACWVPDFETKSGLAGILSHPQKLPSIPVKYLGPISRFEKCTATIQKKYDLLVIISGPEPQRSVFENKIFQQSASSAKEIVIVRGLPGDKSVSSNKNVTIFNHLNAGQLNKLICESELIICRSGYTSIMDMMKLKKKMILVPTPGQPEQEYLAAYLTQNHYALGISQKDFSLDKAVTLAASFTFNHIDTDTNDYKPILKEFLQTISS